MQIFDSLARDVSIDLGCRKIAVPKKHLYDTKIGAVIQ